MLRKLLLALSATAGLGIANGCGSHSALAPATEQRYTTLDIVPAQGALRATFDTVVTISRTLLLTQDISQSAIIGPEGGTIELVASGGRAIFPPGALTTRMRVTMTAKAGWNVAYEFAPHGITFAVPVIIEQNVSNLLSSFGGTRSFQVGYYPDNLDAVLVGTRKSLARVTELRQLLLDRLTDPRVARFTISHFSGYILSSGFASGGGGSDGGDPGSGQP